MIRFLLLVASLCTALPAAARTQSARCAVNFAGGVPPAVDAKHSVQTRLLCFRGFAVQYSGLTKTPLWSAEHLTPRRMRAADAQPREGAFHPEPRLPATMQSTLADYRGSGYDRGHMAPSGDMPDPRSQRDSFSLANIVPQAPCNNQVIWEQIESGVRAYVAQGNDVFVVAGPIYEGETVSTIGNGVAVPRRIFKAIFNRKTGEAGAFVTTNTNEATGFEPLSIDALKASTGIDLFPAAPAMGKAASMQLPPLPAPRYRCRPR